MADERTLHSQSGAALLYIVTDRQSQMLESQFENSSELALLDQAALDMRKRAPPLPTIPDDMLQEQLELVVPVPYFST